MPNVSTCSKTTSAYAHLELMESSVKLVWNPKIQYLIMKNVANYLIMKNVLKSLFNLQLLTAASENLAWIPAVAKITVPAWTARVQRTTPELGVNSNSMHVPRVSVRMVRRASIRVQDTSASVPRVTRERTAIRVFLTASQTPAHRRPHVSIWATVSTANANTTWLERIVAKVDNRKIH